MLKRQADKAAESEGVSTELSNKQTRLFSYLWHNFQRERNRLNEEKEESGRILINMQREVDKLTDEILFGRLEKGGQVTIGIRNNKLNFTFKN